MAQDGSGKAWHCHTHPRQETQVGRAPGIGSKTLGEKVSLLEDCLTRGTEPVEDTGCPPWGPAVGSHGLKDACHHPCLLQVHGPEVVPWLEPSHTAQVQRVSSGSPTVIQHPELILLQ